MSKNCNETYDVTIDAAKDTILRMQAFYDAHPVTENPDDSVAIEFDFYMELVIKAWRDMEYQRHPYDYNSRMAEHCDKSPRTLRNIYNN